MGNNKPTSLFEEPRIEHVTPKTEEGKKDSNDNKCTIQFFSKLLDKKIEVYTGSKVTPELSGHIFTKYELCCFENKDDPSKKMLHLAKEKFGGELMCHKSLFIKAVDLVLQKLTEYTITEMPEGEVYEALYEREKETLKNINEAWLNNINLEDFKELLKSWVRTWIALSTRYNEHKETIN